MSKEIKTLEDLGNWLWGLNLRGSSSFEPQEIRDKVCDKIEELQQNQITFDNFTEYLEDTLETPAEQIILHNNGSGKITSTKIEDGEVKKETKALILNGYNLKCMIRGWKQSNQKQDKYEPIENMQEWQVAAQNDNLYYKKFNNTEKIIKSQYNGQEHIKVYQLSKIIKLINEKRYFKQKEE